MNKTLKYNKQLRYDCVKVSLLYKRHFYIRITLFYCTDLIEVNRSEMATITLK